MAWTQPHLELVRLAPFCTLQRPSYTLWFPASLLHFRILPRKRLLCICYILVLLCYQKLNPPTDEEMANPLPPDRRGYGSLFRTSEVMKVPARFLLPYPASLPNPHDDMLQETLCNICETCGNVKNSDPLARGDEALEDAPETGRTYLWSTPMLERNHRCPMCRLVWRTMLPYFRKLLNDGPPNAVMGLNRSVESGGGRWIELVPMVYKHTLDNQDQRGSGQVVSTT